MIAAFLLAIRILAPGDSVDATYEKVPAPSIEMKMNMASATTVPWIDSNAWRYERGLRKAYYSELPAGSAPLAAAEAAAWGVDAVLQPAKEDAAALDAMLAFINKVGSTAMPPRANIGIIDDGSDEIPEVLNLLSRRNLLYRVLKTPDRSLALNIKLGSKQYPREAAKDPNGFAARVREELSDDRRMLRMFGTYTVLANLTGNEHHSRLHLINYARRPVTDVRVRVLGSFKNVRLAEANNPEAKAQDVLVSGGATEFTVPQIKTYAVIDLE